MRQGRMKEALELTNKRLETDQGDATAWQLRGQINYMLAEYDQSIMDLKRSKNLLDTPVTRLILAKTYLKSRHMEDAITELKSIVEDPQAPEEARNLLERIYLRAQRKEALNDFFTKINSALPESVYWHSRAAGFAYVTEDLAKAEQLYELALRKSKEQGHESADALGGYLRTLLAEGKTDKLLQEGAKFIDGNLAPVAYFRMAEGKIKLGDRATAIQYCRMAIDKASDNTTMTAQVIEYAYQLIGKNETETICSQKLNDQPKTLAANWAMYNLAKLKGDYNKAVEYIEICNNLSSNDSDMWFDCTLKKAEALIMGYYKTSDNKYLKDAMNAYESLLAKMPTNTYVLNNVAYLLAENNQDLNKAMEYAKRACDTKPDDPMYLDTYAFVCCKVGKYSEAAQFAQAAIQQYEAQQIEIPVEVYEHLGQAQEKLGETSKARAAYEQALDIGGENIQKPLKERITAEIEQLDKQKVNTGK
jgi:tetratricopeptide (TPR) repeat protein